MCECGYAVRWGSMEIATSRIDDAPRGLGSAGLTESEVRERRAQQGANVLPEPKRPGVLAIVAEELRNPLLLVLACAALVAIIAGERIDGAFIVVALAVTSVFGVLMALRAERALASLRELLQPTTRVVRDGREVEIPIVDLVPGDRIILARGMRVPADAQLVAADALEIDESALTGE